MAGVFISYVHENSDLVSRLAKALRESGVIVWLDRDSIEPAARWRDSIKNAIRKGSFFIACFSAEYNRRDSAYMNEEITIAIDELRRKPSDKDWFIPVLLNDTDIPSRRISSMEDLSDLQAVKLFENWDLGLRRILRLLGDAHVWHLIDIVERPFEKDRLHAIQQLGEIGAGAKPALPELIKAAKENVPEIKSASLEALGNIGPAAAAAVPVVVAAFRDSDEKVRRCAVDALGKIGAVAVESLRVALEDPVAYGRRCAADALGKIGPAAVEAVPRLAVIALDDSDEDVRFSAIDAVGKISPTSAEVLPALVVSLEHKELRVRLAAVHKLRAIGAAAVPALVVALGDPDSGVRWTAVDSLGQIGPDAAEAVPALAAAFRDPDKDVRRWASLVALRKIGAAAVPALEAALTDPDEDIRSWAGLALGRSSG